jgi:maleylpyruvate isomerase
LTGRLDLTATVPWMRQGTAHLVAWAGKLTDDQMQAPSSLPGWRRSHVVGHIARNAEALARLATWARTAAENRMYTGPEQRAAEIEMSARASAAALRSELISTADALDDALAMLGPDTWAARVRSAQGRDIPAAEIPWMRIREVWIHAVDLGTGATVGDFPAGVVDLLLDDAAAVLSGKKNCPSVVLRPTDRDREWRLSPGTVVETTDISAPAADLAGWLTGRVAGSALPGDAPDLPRWL